MARLYTSPGVDGLASPVFEAYVTA
jgi:hypothetical protein